MPGSNGDDGTLALPDSGIGWTVDTGSVWSESPNTGGSPTSASGWGGFLGQIAAAGANVGLQFAAKDLQGNGYRYNPSAFTFGPGYPQNQTAGSFLSSGIMPILIIALIVLVIVKVLK